MNKVKNFACFQVNGRPSVITETCMRNAGSSTTFMVSTSQVRTILPQRLVSPLQYGSVLLSCFTGRQRNGERKREDDRNRDSTVGHSDILINTTTNFSPGPKCLHSISQWTFEVIRKGFSLNLQGSKCICARLYITDTAVVDSGATSIKHTGANV